MSEMNSIPSSLLCYFTATIEERDGEYVVRIPEKEISDGALDLKSPHHVAVFGSEAEREQQKIRPNEAEVGPEASPPVREGEEMTLEITDTGKEGDGVAKVNESYIVIIPGGQKGDVVDVEVVAVKEKFAIAEQNRDE